jgi:hypothetical protein
MKKELFPTLGKVGFVSTIDLLPHDIPVGAWDTAINVRFKDGCVQRFAGQQQIFDAPAVTPYYLQPYNRNGVRWWIHAGLSTVYADNGTTRQNITPAAPPTGAIDDRYTGGTLTGIHILNNGKDAPWSWDGGAGLFVPLANWPAATTAGAIRVFGQFLVALDVTKAGVRYPHMIKWSHPAEPGALPVTWDPTDLTRLAGERDISAGPGLLVDALELGNQLIIYKEGSIYGCVATNDSKVFDFTNKISVVNGILARGCVAAAAGGHVVLTNGDVILHTGAPGSDKSIIDGRTREWLFKQIDSPNRMRCFVVANPRMNEVWICYPEQGKATCTAALVWNWKADTWQPRELTNVTYGAGGQIDYATANSWGAQTTTWGDASFAWGENPFSQTQDRLLMCNTAPRIDIMDNSNLFNTLPFTSTMARSGLVIGDPFTVKQTLEYWPNVDAVPGTRLQIELGGQMKVNDPVRWAPPFTFVVGTHSMVPRQAAGRMLAVRYQSLDNQQWRVRNAMLRYLDRGNN